MYSSDNSAEEGKIRRQQMLDSLKVCKKKQGPQMLLLKKIIHAISLSNSTDFIL